jgi:hypothetical protein
VSVYRNDAFNRANVPILALPLDVFGCRDALPAPIDNIIGRQAKISFYAFCPQFRRMEQVDVSYQFIHKRTPHAPKTSASEVKVKIDVL